MNASHDVKDMETIDVLPAFDVLCAGFPCQPFSKGSTDRKGFNDTRGTIFFYINEILKRKQPKYFILENVRSIVTHDHGNTWHVIKQCLKDAGYQITETPLIMSPVQFGVPQHRGRVLIMGKLGSEPINIENDLPRDQCVTGGIYKSVPLQKTASKKYHISEYEECVLDAWDEFYNGIDQKVIGYPIWAELFIRERAGLGYKMPKYLAGNVEDFPKWKRDFIEKNMFLYRSNKQHIDKWLKKYNNLQDFKPTDRKFEWQAGETNSSLWEGIIQFRPSGVRVSSPRVFPALVAMVHIPIIGRYKRRLTPREAARLQRFPDAFKCNPDDHAAYKQFGNAVNVEAVQYFAGKLLREFEE